MIHGAVLQRQAVVHRIDERPAVVKDHEFKKVNDEETKRVHFPSNYPATDS